VHLRERGGAGKDLAGCRERADSRGLVDASAGVAIRGLRCCSRVHADAHGQGETVLASMTLRCALDS
jgi:hypothetical protein